MSHINMLRNQFRCKGNIGKEPESSYTPGGTMVTKCSIAVRMSKWNPELKESEWVTEWFDLVIFGKQAEAFVNLVGKGTFVEIAGELTWNKWTDSEGKPRKTLNIVIEAFDVLKNGLKQGDGAETSNAAESSGGGYSPEDDIPF